MNNLVLTLDVTGQPHRWMAWQDAITLKCKNLISFELGDIKDTKYGGYSRLTGERSEIEIAPIIALKGKFKYNASIPPLTNKNLFVRDKHTCGYCGRIHKEDKLSKDHIIPVSRGGLNIWVNVICCCKTCNREKDDSLLSEIGWKLLFLPYIPSPYEKLLLSNRNILPVQMDFLQNFIPAHSRLKQ